MNTIWSIRTGILDFFEAIIRTCRSWVAKYPFIKTVYTIFSWISLTIFVLSLFFIKESRTMFVQYLWSFYVLLQFWFLCRSKTIPWKLIVLFVLAGVYLVVPFTTLTVNALHAIFSGNTSDTWSMSVVTPIFEELWKLLPLGIFLLFSRRASALSLSDNTLIGAATGVGFQLMEELSRRWTSSGPIGYSYTWLGGETIHWDFFSLFPGRFEESFFPTLMTVGHPVHTAMIALACGIAYRMRRKLTEWVFLFPVIILLWTILDHMAYNGQNQLPGWVLRIHHWTGSGYKTQPVFLLMLAASVLADYWSLNKVRNSLPSLPSEPLLNPFTELWNMVRSFCLDRGKFIYWLGFYRERRELGFHILYGNEEAAGRQEPINDRVKALCQALTGLAIILLVAGLFAGIGAQTDGSEPSCFSCMFDSLQNWWDHLHWYQQFAIVLGALALSMLFVGFGSALSFAMTGMWLAGSGHEIAGYIRDPKKLLTPERALSFGINFALNRIPFGKALGWAGAKGSRFGRKLLDKLGFRKPKVEVPVHAKPHMGHGGNGNSGSAHGGTGNATPEAGSGGAAKPPNNRGGRGSSSDGGDPNQPHNGEGDKSNEKGTGKVLLHKLRADYDTHLSQVQDVVWKKGKGVLGGHNLHNFEEVFTNNGWKMDDLIISRTPHPTINGVYEIKYQLPAKDMTGKIIEGQYKNIPFPKTVYDPSVIPDDKMLEWGRQAMANATRSANGRILTGTAPNGLMFQGYIVNGEITNFFPILEKP